MLAKVSLLGMVASLDNSGLSKRVVEPPISVQLKWDGDACNRDGRVSATIANVGDKDIRVPDQAILGYFGLFVARVKSQKGVSGTVGDQFRTPYKRESLSGAGVRVLRPGEAFSYRIQLVREFSYGDDNFSSAYLDVIALGGKLGLIYALNDGQKTGYRNGFFFKNFLDRDMITSNTLVCSSRHAE